MDLTTIEGAISAATSIIGALIKAAPAIEQGAADIAPYAEALGKMLMGSNATAADVEMLLTQLETDSADFQTPLPADDGTTTT
jgi:hypothetical protein